LAIVIETKSHSEAGFTLTEILIVSSEGFGLYDYVNGEWEETFTDGWHDSYRLQFEREEAKLDLPKTTAPSILFHPTGLSTPFELAMSNGQTEYVLEASGNGRVVLRKSQ